MDMDARSDSARSTEEKRLLVQQLLQKKREGIRFFPLSFAQQRLWFLEQLMPGQQLYNVLTGVQLKGRVDVSALERSFQTIIQRHETLRTTFTLLNDQPVQVIMPTLDFHLLQEDVSTLPAEEREQQVQQSIEREKKHVFSLDKGPLLRAVLLSLADERWLLLLNMHHIVTDGWSMGVLVQELVTCYSAFVQGVTPELPTLSAQYADFARWQRSQLQKERLEQLLAYWRKQLDGSTPLELPTTYPRPAELTYHGSTLSFTLAPALCRALETLSIQEEATLYMTLLAAFQMLLARYTGQRDIAVGTPIANRTRYELEGLIGIFINSLVIRCNLPANPSYREVLQQVKTATTEAYAHQDVPFEKLVEELQPDRTLNRSPLFQVIFTLQNAPTATVSLPGVSVTPLEIEHDITRYDLEFNLRQHGHELEGLVVYSTDLFSAAFVQQMIAHFQNILACILENPDIRLSELALLSEQERERLCKQWSAGEACELDPSFFQATFEAFAAQQPDKPALVWGEKRITYRELNERANQLAHSLMRAGIGPEVATGVCLERSPWQVIAFLAILKAGGIFVPLDPTYPRERLAFILTDAHISVLLTQEHLKAIFSLSDPVTVIALDQSHTRLEMEPRTNPLPHLSPENIAYIIYTSGSTGKPKGVMIPHRGLLNVLEAQKQIFGLSSNDRILQFSSFSFDMFIAECLMSFGCGATLHMLEAPSALLLGPTLAEMLFQQRITVAALAPSALATLPLAELPDLRVIATTGEACQATLVQQWGEKHHFYNAYGPTEGSIFVSIGQCVPGETDPLPIGRPILNVRAYLLDTYGYPVPAGVPGEICIGGPGVARGYVHRPELTAEYFIPDPFSGEPGARLYRTGDLARYRQDGTLEFLGRVDFQVKIRGFRIEPGEIETVLEQHPDIARAVVVAQEQEQGDKRLVAYIVARKECSQLDSGALRQHVQAQLPDYMVPSAFFVLDTLPLTPTGKIDRQRLPRMDKVQVQTQREYIAPGNNLELMLAHHWEEVLGVERVSIRDNFFELGGHSLLMTRLHNRLQQVLQQEIRLLDLFKYPTIQAFAQFLDSQKRQTGKALLQQSARRAEARLQAQRQRRQGREQRRATKMQ
ncbi:hypothetical protein KTH_62150 [Thermosporothrix hazakensis]|jgi:amino acid adenylation domain-containing protein|nr:hypothetical protein KTC_18110 [Thermosporothrix sp. COM3]GCE51346.1 hypothetical protein KTH_62150 [Thermosporothrix hazakensis]